MGCKKCKEKGGVNEIIGDSFNKTQKGVTIFIIIWTVFAIYGIYTFVNLFI